MPDRLTQLRQSFRNLKLTAFLISSSAHLRYLFGFTGSNGVGLITSDQSFFVTDWRYGEQAKQEVQHAEMLTAFRDLFAPLKERNAIRAGERLGFESHHLHVRMLSQLHKTFPQTQFVATEHVVEKIAACKSPAEIAAIRRAIAISTQVWNEVLPLIKPGVNECDIAAEIVYRGRKLGADREAFEPIVASGWRSALPHATSSRKTFQAGEMVLMDFGFLVDGYPSDITRTIAVGDPETRMKRIYEHVRRANELSREHLRPGLKGLELDKVVRDYLSAQGLGEAFNHSLGHGLSIGLHSFPRIGPINQDVIPLGAVVALEPGVYLSGIGGVRIEDDVLVTETGCEVLTSIPRELMCVA